jgi:hypothetical protein
MARFETTGIPWTSVVGFVTHTEPKEPDIFRRLATKGVMGVLGTSRTIDRAYRAGEIDRARMHARYRDAVAAGAHIVEADLGVEAGEALEARRAAAPSRQRYFTIFDASSPGTVR